MGSLGSFVASVRHIKRVKVKTLKENSKEDIEEFIKKNKNILIVQRYRGEIKKGEVLLSVEISHEYEDYSEEILLSDLGLENVDANKFLDDEVYKTMENFKCEEIPEDEMGDDEDWIYHVVDKSAATKLKFLNLKAITKDIDMWSLSNPNFLENEEYLADCHDYIYCGNDNSTTDDFKVTKKFIDSLSVGDVIRLHANGDGEHC